MPIGFENDDAKRTENNTERSPTTFDFIRYFVNENDTFLLGFAGLACVTALLMMMLLRGSPEERMASRGYCQTLETVETGKGTVASEVWKKCECGNR